MPFERQSAPSSRRPFGVTKPYYGTAFFVLVGLYTFGCGDSGSLNPVVELASLTVAPGSLQPAFSAGITQYTVDLSDNITSVTVTAQPAVAGDTVTINGQSTTSSVITLGAAGTTTPVSIVVSEADTNSRTYTILLVRAGLTGNNSLQNLTVSPGTLVPSFDPNEQAYTIDVANNVERFTVTPTLSDPNATMTVNRQATGSGQPHTISLSSSNQTTSFPIVVTAQNGSQKTYFLTVSRGVSGNNGLRSLPIFPGSLSPTFSTGTVGYTVTVPSWVRSITVRPTLLDTRSSMTVNGQGTNSGQARTITLNGPGSTTSIHIIVIAQNGTSKTYTVNVARAVLTGNNNLSALAVSPGELVPRFSPNRLAYSVDVAEHVTSVTLSATKADPNTIMSGSVDAGAGTATGQATIPLDGPGTSQVASITVTPPTQNSKTYTITIERAAQAGNNNLQSLAVSPGDLVPRFSPNRTGYTVNVGSDVTSVTVIAVPQDPNAGMEVNGQGTNAGQARNISLGPEGSSTSISIRVNPPNGNAKIYTITVDRAPNGGSENRGNENNRGNRNNRGDGNGGNNGGDRDEEDDD